MNNSQRYAFLLVLVVCIVVAGCAAPNDSPARAATTQPTSAAAAPAHKTYTFVIVHGAWGGGWAFKEVDRLLRADGHAVYRPTLTGQGERVHLASPDVGLQTHIQDVVNAIEFEDLHDVVLVGHSYGGMVITGVADRIPDRIAHLVYLDAILPEDGESVNTTPALHRGTTRPSRTEGFIVPQWVKPNQPPPHDVPQSAKTFSDPIVLKNQAAARAIPTTYILTVDADTRPEDDSFFPSYERAKARGWTVEVMEGDHNVQWSNPRELVRRLEKAP
jgi:pimeloyl-ACP methyl ester carboxylesterase